MKRILLIAKLDLQRFLKEKSSYIWLFLMPLGFVYFTGFMNQSQPKAPENPLPWVLIENGDQGFLGAHVLRELEKEGLRKVPQERAADATRGIRIPQDFTQNILNKESAEITFFQIEGEREEAEQLIETRLIRTLVAVNSQLFRWASTAPTDAALTEADLNAFANESDLVRLNVSYAGRKPIPSGYNQSLPGNLVMFLIMNVLIFGAASILEERRGGCLKRLATYPISKSEIIAGKVLGRVFLGGSMIVFFLLVGAVFFKVNVIDQWPAIVLTLILLSWVAASAGALIGALCASEEKAIGISILSTMLMGALGGCWWPMEIVPDTMKTIGHIFPTAWAMDALHQLISFGAGFNAIGVELAALLGYAIFFNLLAARFMRFQ